MNNEKEFQAKINQLALDYEAFKVKISEFDL